MTFVRASMSVAVVAALAAGCQLPLDGDDRAPSLSSHQSELAHGVTCQTNGPRFDRPLLVIEGWDPLNDRPASETFGMVAPLNPFFAGYEIDVCVLNFPVPDRQLINGSDSLMFQVLAAVNVIWDQQEPEPATHPYVNRDVGANSPWRKHRQIVLFGLSAGGGRRRRHRARRPRRSARRSRTTRRSTARTSISTCSR
jgi:hypothetical protein